MSTAPSSTRRQMTVTGLYRTELSRQVFWANGGNLPTNILIGHYWPLLNRAFMKGYRSLPVSLSLSLPLPLPPLPLSLPLSMQLTLFFFMLIQNLHPCNVLPLLSEATLKFCPLKPRRVGLILFFYRWTFQIFSDKDYDVISQFVFSGQASLVTCCGQLPATSPGCQDGGRQYGGYAWRTVGLSLSLT